jgi:hypothetical protein
MGAGGRIQFFTNGSERLRINCAGNIGIGTFGPTTKFEVGDVSGGVTRPDFSINTVSTASSITIGRLSSVGNDNTSFRIRDRVDRTILYTTVSTVDVGQSDYSSTNLTIKNGNLVIGTSGKGIDFSATANSSGTMTSELLSDYEEGTWTPTTNSAGGVSFTGTARYIKIGKQVTINVERLIFPSTTNPTTLALSGLPFVCESSNNGNAALITTNANVLRALVVGGTSNIYFYPDASVSATNITNGTGSDIYALQLTYFVS